MIGVMPRTLRPGQRSELYVVDVGSLASRLVFSSAELLFEAPNWTPAGDLVVNGDGRLFRVDDGLHEIELGGVPPINNDHVVSPDGSTVYVSADDGHLYAVPLPHTLGQEAAATVTAVGPGVTEFKVGDRVGSAAVNGAYAEEAIAPVANTVRVPAAVSAQEVGGGEWSTQSTNAIN